MEKNEGNGRINENLETLNRGDKRFLEIWYEEGFNISKLPSVRFRDNELLNQAARIFGFLPSFEDPRWIIPQILLVFQRDFWIERESVTGWRSKFREAFQHAAAVIYLSDRLSTAGPFGLFEEMVIRQNVRACANCLVGKWFYDSLPSDDEIGGIKVIKRVSCEGRCDGRGGINPCPEALYQLLAFNNNGVYLGRIGFNIHLERENPKTTNISAINPYRKFQLGSPQLLSPVYLDGMMVVSITNIQGVRGMGYSNNPGVFNNLVRYLINRSYEQSLFPVKIRGIRNHPHPNANHRLYNAVFKREGVKRIHYKPKNQ